MSHLCDFEAFIGLLGEADVYEQQEIQKAKERNESRNETGEGN